MFVYVMFFLLLDKDLCGLMHTNLFVQR